MSFLDELGAELEIAATRSVRRDRRNRAIGGVMAIAAVLGAGGFAVGQLTPDPIDTVTVANDGTLEFREIDRTSSTAATPSTAVPMTAVSTTAAPSTAAPTSAVPTVPSSAPSGTAASSTTGPASDAAVSTTLPPTTDQTALPSTETACRTTPSRIDDVELADGGSVSAFDAAGSPAELRHERSSVAPRSGRYDNQIDYMPGVGSERLEVVLPSPQCSLTIGIRSMETNEWNGYDEAARWRLFDDAGTEVATGTFVAGESALVGGVRSFEITSPDDGTRLTIEAAPYGTAGSTGPPGAETASPNNSDFALSWIEIGRW